MKRAVKRAVRRDLVPAGGNPVRAPGLHVAAADCETPRPGRLAQPVNAWSSLAATVAGAAGLAAVRQTRVDRTGPDGGRSGPARRRALAVAGLAIAANGPGGLAFHGPGGRWGRWLHDVAVVATLSAVAAVDIGDLLAGGPGRRESAAVRRNLLASQVAVDVLAGALLTRRADLGGAVQGVLGGAVAIGEVAVGWRGLRPVLGPGVLMGAGALIHARSRTGCPWCRPDSLLQGHAAWHVLSAAALGWWGVRAAGAPVTGRHPTPTGRRTRPTRCAPA